MPKAKKVSYELIPRSDSLYGGPLYGLLDDLVDEHHHDLRAARIALGWCTSWRADVDGRITLGKCRKASDLDRELAAYDFVILLARWFWRSPDVTDHQRRALLDHELCHAAVKYDEKGEPVEDERGRKVYRVRKHDLEEFCAIAERYGTYKRDLEQFAAALRKAPAPAYEPCGECVRTPGWVDVVDDEGIVRARRCGCFTAWQTQHAELVAS